MADAKTYLNGSLHPADQVGLSFSDAGFIFGATATDLVRTFRHQLYKLDEHLVRFRQSCELCRIPQPRPDAELKVAAEHLVEENSRLLSTGDDLALVMFATPGPIGRYAGRVTDGPPTLGMHTFPLPLARYRGLFREGARLVIPPIRRDPAIDARAKHRSRLSWWLAEMTARDSDPSASALMLDADGFLTETAAANFLIVKDSSVVSPSRGSILPGVSLGIVRELTRELGIPFAERPIKPSEAKQADEALLTSTPYCVAGVSQIDGHALPWPSHVCQLLLDAWSTRIGFDISGQILSGG